MSRLVAIHGNQFAPSVATIGTRLSAFRHRTALTIYPFNNSTIHY
jgi:hypothetical protein